MEPMILATDSRATTQVVADPGRHRTMTTNVDRDAFKVPEYVLVVLKKPRSALVVLSEISWVSRGFIKTPWFYLVVFLVVLFRWFS